MDEIDDIIGKSSSEFLNFGAAVGTGLGPGAGSFSGGGFSGGSGFGGGHHHHHHQQQQQQHHHFSLNDSTDMLDSLDALDFSRGSSAAAAGGIRHSSHHSSTGASLALRPAAARDGGGGGGGGGPPLLQSAVSWSSLLDSAAELSSSHQPLPSFAAPLLHQHIPATAPPSSPSPSSLSSLQPLRRVSGASSTGSAAAPEPPPSKSHKRRHGGSASSAAAAAASAAATSATAAAAAAAAAAVTTASTTAPPITAISIAPPNGDGHGGVGGAAAIRQQTSPRTQISLYELPMHTEEQSAALTRLMEKVSALDAQLSEAWSAAQPPSDDANHHQFQQLEQQYREAAGVAHRVLQVPNLLVDQLRAADDATRRCSVQLCRLQLAAADGRRARGERVDAAQLVRVLLDERPTFPGVLSKGRKTAEALSVMGTVLLAPSVRLAPASSNTANVVVVSESPLFPNTHELFELTQVPVIAAADAAAAAAAAADATFQFPLRFAVGTRRASARLKFSCRLSVAVAGGRPCTVDVTSDLSEPFACVTHESQWEDSAGAVLRSAVFGGDAPDQAPATFARLRNVVQRFFLATVRQDPSKPVRPISLYDFDYVRRAFFPNTEATAGAGAGAAGGITAAEYDRFWKWFGGSLQLLRFRRHVNALWQTGLFYGYLNRADVERALRGQPPGTFMIRFSERHSGKFGICYVGADRIKHYLVQTSDTAAAKKTLVDFLMECPQFKVVLVYTGLKDDGRPQLVATPKLDGCRPFLTNRSLITKTTDYEGYEGL